MGNKTCGVSGMVAAAHREKNTHTAICVVGKGEHQEEKGDINFHSKCTSHLALLIAQKATEMIISGLHLRPLELDGEKAMAS